ncbi:hypothetical protein ADK55_19070, partial [Streptomyces sp. WM4235]|uniref:condensation domain-containing protein n=1 Tax=Streptomyces sp. WM4235 TaxID=1415551 RepID=UPI0006C00D25
IGRFAMSAVVELPVGIDRAGVVAVLGAVVDRHEVLRARLVVGGLVVGERGSVDVAGLLSAAGVGADVQGELDVAAGLLDPWAGVMVRFVWFEGVGRLLVVVHHLVVDGVSWRILLPDLAQAWVGLRSGGVAGLEAPVTSVRRWSHALVEDASRGERVAELGWWLSVVEGPDPLLGSRALDPARDTQATV